MGPSSICASDPSQVRPQEQEVDGVTLLRNRLLAGEDFVLLELLRLVVERLPQVEDVASYRDAGYQQQRDESC